MSTKEFVKELFYDEGLNVSQVAKKLHISKQAVSKHLITDRDKYEKEKKKRRLTEWKKLSTQLFYDERLLIKEVAEKVGKSSVSVSRYLSNNNSERYKSEKVRRKKESARREKIRKRNWSKNY